MTAVAYITRALKDGYYFSGISSYVAALENLQKKNVLDHSSQFV